MITNAIDYITEDADGNEIARETGEIYTIESAEDLEALFAQVVANMEAS